MPGNLLVKLLGQHVDLAPLVLVVLSLLPELKLRDHLVGETAGHNKRGVTGGATEVEQAALRKNDNAVAVVEGELVNLRLDDQALGARFVQAVHINLVIEVADVTDDRVVLHLLHLREHDDVLVSRCGDEDIGLSKNVVQSDDLEAFHARLEGADGVNFGHHDTGATGLHRLGAALANIAVSADNDDLSGNHHISGPHDTVRETVSASVDVIEFALGNRVVDVDRSEQKLVVLRHLDQAVDTGCGFLAHAKADFGHLGPVLVVLLELFLEHEENFLVLSVLGLFRVGFRAILLKRRLGFDTLVNEKGGITTVINDHIGAIRVLPGERLVSAPPVGLQVLSFPRKNGGSGPGISSLGYGGRGVVLSREDVARAPPNTRARVDEGLDENGRLNGHVQGPGDSGALQRLRLSPLLTAGHEPGHLDLGEIELLAAVIGEADVLDLVVVVDHVVSGVTLTVKKFFQNWL